MTEDAKDRHWWRKTLVAAVIAAIGFVFYQTPFYDRACRTQLATDQSWATDYLCPQASRRIPTQQATTYVDSLLAAVRGTQRETDVAERMTDSPTQTEDSLAWRPVIYAVRIDPVQRTTNHNEFTTTVRRFSVRHPDSLTLYGAFYTDDIGLDEIGLRVRLRMTDDGLLARRITTEGRSPLGTFSPRVARAERLTDHYERPERFDDGHPNLGPPHSAHEICQHRTTGGPDQWWASTYLGWVPHSDLEGGDVQVDGVPLCDPERDG